MAKILREVTNPPAETPERANLLTDEQVDNIRLPMIDRMERKFGIKWADVCGDMETEQFLIEISDETGFAVRDAQHALDAGRIQELKLKYFALESAYKQLSADLAILKSALELCNHSQEALIADHAQAMKDQLQDIIAKMHNINSTSPDCKDADTRYTELLAELRQSFKSRYGGAK